MNLKDFAILADENIDLDIVVFKNQVKEFGIVDII